MIRLKCGKGRKFTLRDALYAPEAALCLVSVGRLGDESCKTTFEATCCRVRRGDRVLAEGVREG